MTYSSPLSAWLLFSRLYNLSFFCCSEISTKNSFMTEIPNRQSNLYPTSSDNFLTGTPLYVDVTGKVFDPIFNGSSAIVAGLPVSINMRLLFGNKAII